MRTRHGRWPLAALALACGFACLRCSRFGGESDPEDAGGSDTGTGSDRNEVSIDGGLSDSSLNITGDPIPLSFGHCGSLGRCDSDPAGAWQMTGGCVDENVFAPLSAVCKDLVVADASFAARGVFAVQGSTYASQTSSTYAATLNVSASCRAKQGCGVFTSAFGQGGAHVDCEDAGDGGCACAVSDVLLDDVSTQYTRSAGVLTLGGTATSMARTFDYCVAGDSVTTQETTTGAPKVTYMWTKR